MTDYDKPQPVLAEFRAFTAEMREGAEGMEKDELVSLVVEQAWEIKKLKKEKKSYVDADLWNSMVKESDEWKQKFLDTSLEKDQLEEQIKELKMENVRLTYERNYPHEDHQADFDDLLVLIAKEYTEKKIDFETYDYLKECWGYESEEDEDPHN